MGYDGKLVTFFREARGWSQAELARRAKLSQPSVWALEKQVTKKPGYALTQVSAALGVSLPKLMAKKSGKAGWEDEMAALFAALDAQNQGALIAAAEALLKQQKGGKS